MDSSKYLSGLAVSGYNQPGDELSGIPSQARYVNNSHSVKLMDIDDLPGNMLGQ